MSEGGRKTGLINACERQKLKFCLADSSTDLNESLNESGHM